VFSIDSKPANLHLWERDAKEGWRPGAVMWQHGIRQPLRERSGWKKNAHFAHVAVRRFEKGKGFWEEEGQSGMKSRSQSSRRPIQRESRAIHRQRYLASDETSWKNEDRNGFPEGASVSAHDPRGLGKGFQLAFGC